MITKCKEKSEKLYKKSLEVLVGGVNSPVRSFKELGIDPLIIEKGNKDIITDVDGFDYVDYCCSWGALINGHSHPQVVSKAKEALLKGASFGLTSKDEINLALFITNVCCPHIEKIRFLSSGTEAVMTAIRLSRAFTKRNLIIKFVGNYHGHSDGLLVKSGSGVAELNEATSSGIPKSLICHTVNIPYNDEEKLRECFKNYGKDIAGVIFEPVAANMGLVVPKKEFLEAIIFECKSYGALVIADEVITGFRLGLSGAQGFFNFEADISIYGKIVGAGFPCAAIGGREEILNLLSPLGSVYQAGTLSGNPIAVSAGLANLQLCSQNDYYLDLDHKIKFLLEPLKKEIRDKKYPILIQKLGSMFSFFFTDRTSIENFDDVCSCNKDLFRIFYIKMLEKGVFLSPSQFETNFISSKHSLENLDKTKKACLNSWKEMFS